MGGVGVVPSPAEENAFFLDPGGEQVRPGVDLSASTCSRIPNRVLLESLMISYVLSVHGAKESVPENMHVAYPPHINSGPSSVLNRRRLKVPNGIASVSDTASQFTVRLILKAAKVVSVMNVIISIQVSSRG